MPLALKWFDLIAPEPGAHDPLVDHLREEALANPEVARLTEALEQAWEHPVEFARPGAGEASFNEAWIAAVVRAVRRGDGASYRFLLARRLPPEAASEVHFLCLRVALSL